MMVDQAPFEDRDGFGRFAKKALPCPKDFEAKFIEIGRVACEAHYRAPRLTIDRWLRECGKRRLTELRSARVDARERQRREALSRRDIGQILAQAIPIEHQTLVSPALASAAAQFLRVSRNGGFFISPTGAGDWWVGLKRKSSADLLDMAKSKGFDAASVTGRDE